MTYSDDAKREAIRVSRELLARRHDQPSEPEPTPPEPEVEVSLPDPLTEWRDWHDARARERTAAKIARQYAERREIERQRETAQQSSISRVEFEERLAGERRYQSDVLTEVAANLIERIAKLEATARPTSGESGKVLDLPGPFLRRVN